MAENEEKVLDDFLADASSSEDESQEDVKTDEEKVEGFTEKVEEEEGKKGEKGKKDEEEESEEEKIAEKVVKQIGDVLSGGHDKIAALPTPGGIGILLIVILLIVFALVPTRSGKTRLQLFWMVLTNKVRLTGAQYPDEATDSVARSTKDFTPMIVPPPGPIPMFPISPLTPVTPGLGGGIASYRVPDFGVEELD